MNFAWLVHVYFRHLTAKFQPNWRRQCWGMNFFHLYILPKTLNSIFSKVYFQTLHFIYSFFRFYRAIYLVFFWNMLISVPTTQFCGKLRIHFSNKGNFFLKRVTYETSFNFRTIECNPNIVVLFVVKTHMLDKNSIICRPVANLKPAIQLIVFRISLVMSIFLNFSIDFNWNWSKEQKSILLIIDGKKSIFTTSRPLPVPFFLVF